MNITTLSPPVAEAAQARGTTGPVVGVRTTRIYCHPSCQPGRSPKPENRVHFASVAEARAAGFRPCKKCRPDEPARPSPRSVPIEVETIRYGLGPTPLGFAFVAVSDRGLRVLFFLDEPDPALGLARLKADSPGARLVEEAAAITPLLHRVRASLETGQPCDDLPLDLRGTPFQLQVWNALRSIPAGSTCTYGELAIRLGLPAGAARAVGTACGANPIALVIPCHRVLRANGDLGGYRWGLERKRALLDLERAEPSSQESPPGTTCTAVP
jgi:AraC family transcriptional regulator of adaptative response/methylated-DNA-[protein]-cysteine methyltransferase